MVRNQAWVGLGGVSAIAAPLSNALSMPSRAM
ncbi:Uncharacterised protein [Vibrio cholerae]|nr:Uncharacterised protein [Vibrio cholerae]